MKNPFVNVTVCCVSSECRDASLVGLPMIKVPAVIHTNKSGLGLVGAVSVR